MSYSEIQTNNILRNICMLPLRSFNLFLTTISVFFISTHPCLKP